LLERAAAAAAADAAFHVSFTALRLFDPAWSIVTKYLLDYSHNVSMITLDLFILSL